MLKFSRFLALSYRVLRIMRNLCKHFWRTAETLSWLPMIKFCIALVMTIETAKRLYRLVRSEAFRKRKASALLKLAVMIWIIALCCLIESGPFLVISVGWIFSFKMALLVTIFIVALWSRISGGSYAAARYYEVVGEVRALEEQAQAKKEEQPYLIALRAHRDYLEKNYHRVLVKTVFRSIFTSISILAAAVALLFPSFIYGCAIVSLCSSIGALIYKLSMYGYKDYVHPPKGDPTSQHPIRDKQGIREQLTGIGSFQTFGAFSLTTIQEKTDARSSSASLDPARPDPCRTTTPFY